MHFAPELQDLAALETPFIPRHFHYNLIFNTLIILRSLSTDILLGHNGMMLFSYDWIIM